jgi:glycosidase
MPFYPSPNRDDGYDITDYYGVDDRLGTLGDFVAFVRTAKDRGMRVIVDLVVNHTSDQHPWFRSARRSRTRGSATTTCGRTSRRRSRTPRWCSPTPRTASGPTTSAGQYYLHHFYSHQPDLNIGNPAVREEIAKIAGFWLELGVDGFRVDAVPFLIETGGIDGDVASTRTTSSRTCARSWPAEGRRDAARRGQPADRRARRVLRRRAGRRAADAVRLPGHAAMYLALAREDARPARGGARASSPTSRRHAVGDVRAQPRRAHPRPAHDDEREEVFDAFGPTRTCSCSAAACAGGCPRCSTATSDRIRLVYSLLFSLPGTPVLFYGEEIGMGENLDIDGRLSVRTPMQWTDGRNAGFSDARPSRLRRPIPEGASARSRSTSPTRSATRTRC